MSVELPAHKTKIVATIGPASESPEMLDRLIRAGMNVARLNFSHGEFSTQAGVIRRIREVARAADRRVAIMGDLPGPKMRLGRIEPEPVQLLPGDRFTLTSEDIVGDSRRVSMTFEPLPRVVKPGDRLYLNDGLVQLVVERAAAAKAGRQPFIIAKIVRSDALEHFDEILAAADGIMVARGDLGVEVPIEAIAHTQKQLIAKANVAGRPVITATQMLESMVSSRLPTRAEATDVANAILDGTDCVMLSGESAMGRFPEEAVTMLAKIAAFTEAHRPRASLAARRELLCSPAEMKRGDRMASLVEHALATVPCDLVLVPTRGGTTARTISRCKPSAWIVAPGGSPSACQGLAFSYGVHPVDLAEEPADWKDFASRWVRENGVAARHVMLVAGPSPHSPEANQRLELMSLSGEKACI
jgi:pyruvate kinase